MSLKLLEKKLKNIEFGNTYCKDGLNEVILDNNSLRVLIENNPNVDKMVLCNFYDEIIYHNRIIYNIGKYVIHDIFNTSTADTKTLLLKLLIHDNTKILEKKESNLFVERYIQMCKLIESNRYTYMNTSKYLEILFNTREADEIHFKRNDHHPEHFQCKFEDMDKIHIFEIFLEWMADHYCKYNTFDKFIGYKSVLSFYKNRYKIDNVLYNKIVNTFNSIELGYQIYPNILNELEHEFTVEIKY